MGWVETLGMDRENCLPDLLTYLSKTLCLALLPIFFSTLCDQFALFVENDTRVGEPHSPIAEPLERAPVAHSRRREQLEEPSGSVLDRPADVGDGAEATEVLFLPEGFAEADRVDHSSLVKG